MYSCYLTVKEYDNLLQKIADAEQETRNEKRKAEEEKRASQNREQQTIQKANQVIENGRRRWKREGGKRLSEGIE